jgi:5-methylthioribose kinase
VDLASEQAIREDLELKLCISRLKAKFMESTEALLHGDLHTGSVMVKEGRTYVSIYININIHFYPK